MKTQILELETHDDIISVRDKMGWGQTRRILLVWPSKGLILQRRLDLVLLLRRSAQIGAQLALVTQDAEVRYNANLLKIPVFDSVPQAHASKWRGGRRYKSQVNRLGPRPDLVTLRAKVHPNRSPWRENPATRWGVFSLSLLALLGLFTVLFPGAKVTLNPAIDLQKMAFTVVANPNAKAVNLAGELPARVESVVVEGRDHIQTSGKMMLAEKAATTRLRFTNQTNRSVDIPKGLVVSTSGSSHTAPLRFETTEAGTVPAGAGKFISLPARALIPGNEGNVAANRIVAIEGPLGLNLTTTNLLPASGGSSLPVKSPTPDDYDTLYQNLYNTLEKTAISEIQDSLESGDYLIIPSLELANTKEISFEPDNTSGQANKPADQLDLTMRLEFIGEVVSVADLNAVANSMLGTVLPAGFTPIPETLVTEHTSQPELGPGSTYRWKVKATQQIQADIQENRLKNLVRGLTPGQASQVIAAQLPLASPPSITLIPGWWPRLPVWPLRIQISKLDLSPLLK